MSGPPLIEVDWASFSPWRVQAVRHRLADHALLQLPALGEFAARQEKGGRVRSHGDGATAATPFNTAPQAHPNRKTAAATLADLEHAKAWTSLLNIQSDDVYRGLVDEVLDELQPEIEKRDPGMSYRAGWIFLTSPNAITPFHMDREHNFILQVQGRKRLYVWEPDDEVAVSEAARDAFHAVHNRDLVVWREELRARAHVFDLEPGMGAYMPSTAPHLVENADNASITVSFTYYTEATRRDSLLHTLHYYMRRRGFAPAPVGRGQAREAVEVQAGRVLLGARFLLNKVRGRPIRRPRGRYAQHLVS